MLNGELKNKIDRLRELFWIGGITTPLAVVEQLTYLMFIHDLDAVDNQRAKESAMLGLPHKSMFAGEVQVGERTIPGNQLKWSVFHDFPAGQMYLQKPGTGYCCKLYASGMMPTNTASRTYLRYDSAWVKRRFFTFGVGIL